MSICPQCQEQMPPLSKICPVCGYSDSSAADPENRSAIETNIKEMNDYLSVVEYAPKPTVADGFKHLAFITLPLFAICAALVAIVSMSDLMWLITLLLVILSVVSLVMKLRNKSRINTIDVDIKESLANYDSVKRMVEMTFGRSREVKTAIQNLDDKLHDALSKHKAAKRRAIFAGSILSLVLIAVFTVISMLVTIDAVQEVKQEYENRIETLLENNKFDQAATAFRAKYADTSDAESYRMLVVERMLEAGETELATTFFFENCIGERGDFDCAKAIVTKRMSSGDRELAVQFVGKCSRLKYKSDYRKLNELLN